MFMWGPGFADPLNHSFGPFVEEAEAPLILTLSWWRVSILVRACAPTLLTGINFDKESLAGKLVPQEKRLIKHHTL